MTKAKQSKVSEPKGLNPKGSTRPVRGKPNQRAAVDTPIEVPVYVRYERHVKPGVKEATSYSLGELLGWTVQVDAWTFNTHVDVKICRDPRRLEVWIDGKKIHTTTKGAGESHPPLTEADDDFPTIAQWLEGGDISKPEGWATKLGKTHAVIKKQDQRKHGIEEPHSSIDDDIIWEDDDEDEIIWEDD